MNINLVLKYSELFVFVYKMKNVFYKMHHFLKKGYQNNINKIRLSEFAILQETANFR